ncbi:hypothetical protein D9756_000646 [Leucocoprinus leucothites]|uniref:CCHC-type domain-containing protein n=1 Tax=Leucocoprinus leucothites TaxID=201217 RepID=A0A8H5GF84_9AGAR|nr:hypothetical protein D9756_000646 [Leucoagaricus leucothites]
MADPEIIDLTDSPVLATTAIAQDVSSKPLTEDSKTQGGEKTPRKRQRKRKRKQGQKSDTQNQDTTAANTRSNSEEEPAEEDHPEDTRQVRRKRENESLTKETDASSSLLQDRGSSSKKQKYKEDTSSSQHDATGNANPRDLFFEDIAPAPLPPNIGNIPPPPSYGNSDPPTQKNDDMKLLLPAHVSVLGSTPVEILPPTESDEEGETDYIKYLDYGGGRQKEFLRYFEEPEDESSKLKRTVCKNCGAEGDHKTADCRVLIVSNMSSLLPLCPGLMHENKTPRLSMQSIAPTEVRVEQEAIATVVTATGVILNSTRQECPTWWRLYVYVTDEDRTRIMDERRKKHDLELGKGGEAYIAEDEWCYNCGDVGHWGDDCKAAHRRDKPAEPSAFGHHNISTGPFYDLEEYGTRPERRLRDWERDAGAWNMHAPEGVGRQGRKKMMEKMRRSAQRFEEESDPDDWFGNSKNARNRGVGPHSHSRSDRDRDRRRDRDRERQRERDRERQRERDRERQRERDREVQRDRERDREHNRRRDRDRERERERDRDREMDRDRDRDRAEHGRQIERDHTQASGIGRDGRDKVTINFKNIDPSRKFLPPAPHDLPARPAATAKPSLLERMGGKAADDPSTNRRNPERSHSGSSSLSIKGAGQRSNGDDNHRSHSGRDRHSGPQYQGGYGR